MEYRNPDQLEPRRRAGRRRVGDRRADRRRDPPLGPPGDAGRGRARPRAARPTGAGTSNGGWTRPACSTSATTRSTTSSGRASVPSLQLVGSPERRDARPQRADRASASSWSAGSPASATARRSSPARCATVRARRPQAEPAARHASTSGPTSNGLDDEVEPPHRFAPTARRRDRRRSASISRSGEIRTIIWATGFRPDYSWLDVPVLDRKGSIRHDGGVVEAPGMYLIGLPFLRRRKSRSSTAPATTRAISATISCPTSTAGSLKRSLEPCDRGVATSSTASGGSVPGRGFLRLVWRRLRSSLAVSSFAAKRPQLCPVECLHRHLARQGAEWARPSRASASRRSRRSRLFTPPRATTTSAGTSARGRVSAARRQLRRHALPLRHGSRQLDGSEIC